VADDDGLAMVVGAAETADSWADETDSMFIIRLSLEEVVPV
jgi:hypothetical protein